MFGSFAQCFGVMDSLASPLVQKQGPPCEEAPDSDENYNYFLTLPFLLRNSAKAFIAFEFPIRLLVLMRPKAFRL